ncbi:MAG: orotate phosphoribosyltransferase [Alphaproteobacteria bacterium]|nr:orotate phosphoribosyltransferase [Alphaproteobacteria bacterium]
MDAKARLKAIVAGKALIKGGAILLASGATSSFYLDMRLVSLDPEGATLIGEMMLPALGSPVPVAVGGMETGAIAVVAAIAQASHRQGRPIPGFYVRKKAKEHGTSKVIEGNIPPAGRVVLVEDVTTTGDSVLAAVAAVRGAGCTVDRVVTVVDRLAGARDNLARHGLELVAILTRDDFGV